MFCETENKYVVTVLSSPGTPTPPTECPNSALHTVAADSISLKHVIYPDEVNVEEHDGKDILTGGKYYAETRKLDIVDGESIPKNFIISYPMNIALYSTRFNVLSKHIGDKIIVNIAPNTVVGLPTAGVSIGATTISIATVTMQNISIGFRLSISEGGTINDLGRILEIDWVNNEIVIETATTDEFTTSALLLLTIRYSEIEFTNENILVFGSDKIGGTLLPKNTPISIDYYNYSTGSKDLTFIVEMTY